MQGGIDAMMLEMIDGNGTHHGFVFGYWRLSHHHDRHFTGLV
jgi:hypothetical protein